MALLRSLWRFYYLWIQAKQVGQWVSVAEHREWNKWPHWATDSLALEAVVAFKNGGQSDSLGPGQAVFNSNGRQHFAQRVCCNNFNFSSASFLAWKTWMACSHSEHDAILNFFDDVVFWRKKRVQGLFGFLINDVHKCNFIDLLQA